MKNKLYNSKMTDTFVKRKILSLRVPYAYTRIQIIRLSNLGKKARR